VCGTGSLHGIGFFPNHIATVVSLMAVSLPFGGTLALTIMTTVFNNVLGIDSSSPLHDVKTLHDPAKVPASIAAVFIGQARVSPVVPNKIDFVSSC
jgi:hypothetical protein